MSQGRPPSSVTDQSPQATLHEIRTAENSAAFLLPILQSMKDSNPKLKLLDVGSGSGTISLGFAKLLLQGHVTGIDLNAAIVSRAIVLAESAGINNIDFQQGSVYELPFADESFDITYCHQVLIHIGNPWDALREMLRVTKKGGIVAAREGDYDTQITWPESPELNKFHDLMAGLMKAGGGTPTAGRELVSWALKAGVARSQVELSYSTSSYNTPSERQTCGKVSILIFMVTVMKILTLGICLAQGLIDQLKGGSRLREKALIFGLGTDDGFGEMAKAWKEWAMREDASLAMLQGEILVHK